MVNPNHGMREIIENLEYIRKKLILPEVYTLHSAPTPEVLVNGEKKLLFCSNNYLGLSTHPTVVNAALKMIKKYGVGSGASRLISGTFDIHLELEKALAGFKKTEDAMVFSAGFSTNVSVIPAIMDLFGLKKIPLKIFRKDSYIFSDELNHASVIDGCRLSEARTIIYKHKNMDDLYKKLKRHRKNRKMIVTDAVFSMDGDVAPLNRIVELAQEYDSMVMIDEAHSTGTLGERGSGIVELFNLRGKVDIIMGTLSKGLGAIGGYIAGRKQLIDFLRIAARGYMFATSFPPHIAAAVIAAIKIIEKDRSIVKKLQENAVYLRNNLKMKGFNTLSSETQIIPVFVGDELKAIQLNRDLFKRGILAGCARWPAVPKGEARIRLSVMSTHTRDHLNYLIETLTRLGKSAEII